MQTEFNFEKVDFSAWLAQVEKDSKGKKFETQPLYTQKDAIQNNAMPACGSWAFISQTYDKSSVIENHNKINKDIQFGVNAIHLVLSLDSGIKIQSLSDFEKLFKNIPYKDLYVSFEASNHFYEYGCLWLAFLKKHKANSSHIIGALNADPLGSLGFSNPSILKNREAIEFLMFDLAHYVSRHFPKITSIEASGVPYHMAGRSADEELALVMASAIEYVRLLTKKGMSLQSIFSQIRLRLCTNSEFFISISKIRAAFLLWDRIQHACGVKKENRSYEIYAEASKISKLDSKENLLPYTVAFFSAALSGVKGILNPIENRLIKNIQLILKHEVEITPDPANGSWYIEKLTYELCENSWGLIQKIEAKGGMQKYLSESLHPPDDKNNNNALISLIKDKNTPLMSSILQAYLQNIKTSEIGSYLTKRK